MKKKMRRFEEGGLSKAQEEYLGGADRTDPYIMARMRRAVPDEPKAAPVMSKADAGEVRDETGMTSRMRRNTETGELYSTDMPKAKPKAEAPKAKPKAEAPKAEPKKAEPKKDSGEEPSFFKGTKGFKNIGEAFKAMRRSAGITSYKSGGKVSSASKRADGCAVKGKTKGRMV
jgi:hypothetical protein